MSNDKVNFILGSDSITVFLDNKPYPVNKQAKTYAAVLDAVRANDTEKLRDLLNLRDNLIKSFNGQSDVIRIDGSSIFYGDREVTGLITQRIFEAINLGLGATPFIKFLELLHQNPSKRAVDELFGFIEKCALPITDDGHFLAYKRVQDNYTDVHSGKFDNSVGQVLTMPRNRVDEDKNRTCSAGLHFCSYDYLAHFSGSRIMVLKINPADVVAIPADYNDTKGRTCRYEVVDEIPVKDYMPSSRLQEGVTTAYASGTGKGWSEFEDEIEEYEEQFEDESVIEDEIDLLTGGEIKDLIQEAKIAEMELNDIAELYGISVEAVEAILQRNNVRYGQDKVAVVVIDKSGDGGSLTNADVREIRNRLKNNSWSLAALARAFDVSPRTIGRIRNNEGKWANIK